jgi:hypothetical protein
MIWDGGLETFTIRKYAVISRSFDRQAAGRVCGAFCKADWPDADRYAIKPICLAVAELHEGGGRPQFMSWGCTKTH